MCHQHPKVVTKLFSPASVTNIDILYASFQGNSNLHPHKDKNVEILHEEDYPVYCYSAFGINNQMTLRKLLFWLFQCNFLNFESILGCPCGIKRHFRYLIIVYSHEISIRKPATNIIILFRLVCLVYFHENTWTDRLR